jgi:membrane-associated protease RseP (regulator of RpoE activity)
MNGKQIPSLWFGIFLIVVLAVPLLIFLTMPVGTMISAGILFWLILFTCVWMFWIFRALGQGERRTPTSDVEFQSEPSGPRMLLPESQHGLISEMMHVQIATEDRQYGSELAGTQVYRGRLKLPAEEVYQRLIDELPDNIVPLIRQDDQVETAIVLMPVKVEEKVYERPSRVWVNWLLFGITILTTTYAGAVHQGFDLLKEPMKFTAGLPYSLGLLLILGLHELGHYFAARYHRINVTPPFFIPVPFALGTFGAFIQMKSPTESRRALFDVAVAGPLAGLVVAIPALIIGLQNSTVYVPEADAAPANILQGTSIGSSILFALLAKVSIADQLQYGCAIQLSPLAFAGWLGLIVTALNLLPIGQLDGGHISRSMFGGRIGESISSVAMWSLFLLAFFVWPGLLFWAIIVFFIAGRGTPPLNDVSPISNARMAIGYFSFLILAMILLPLPRGLWEEFGIRCPYL